jgi:anti-anti-sigma regulatory factor
MENGARQATPELVQLNAVVLDGATIQELQDKIGEVMVPGHPIVPDLVDLTFLDSSAMHCLVRTFEVTGRPVVLQNASRALRRILGHMTQEPEAWVFDEQRQTPMPMQGIPS